MLSGHFFLNFFMKTPCSHAHMWSKNVNCVKTTLYVPENSIECFFPDLSRKTYCSHAHMLIKTRILYKTRCSHAHILSEERQLSQKHCALMSFFQFFHEKPLLSCPYQVKKTSIVTKLQNIMGQKSQQDILFFRNVYFLKTTVLSFAYFVQKMSILLKTEGSHVMCSIFF